MDSQFVLKRTFYSNGPKKTCVCWCGKSTAAAAWAQRTAEVAGAWLAAEEAIAAGWLEERRHFDVSHF